MGFNKIAEIFDNLTNYGITIKVKDHNLGNVRDSKNNCVVWTPYRPIRTAEEFEEFLSNGPTDWIVYNS